MTHHDVVEAKTLGRGMKVVLVGMLDSQVDESHMSSHFWERVLEGGGVLAPVQTKSGCFSPRGLGSDLLLT